MSNRTVRHKRWLLMLSMAAFLLIGLLTIAYAQSSANKFNLNSPAAFPVDI